MTASALPGWPLAAEEVLVVECARRYEMYDQPSYVTHAVDRLAAFFDAHLT